MKFKLSSKYKIDKNIIKKFEQITKLIGKLESINKNVFFEVSIISNEDIKKINLLYRKKDEYTDVLSFCFWENKDIKTNLLGEIFISYEMAELQAKNLNHNLQRELCFLFIHGILHMLGYDHEKISDEKIMFEKQKLVMLKVNLLKLKEDKYGKKS
ncbi:MAG: rRNA maturation RNase YbeY [Mycoplasmoidaceae bacterium]